MIKLYAHRNVIALNRHGNAYVRHVEAMTAEELHSKADIAAELAHRDVQIETLAALLRETRDNFDANNGMGDAWRERRDRALGRPWVARAWRGGRTVAEAHYAEAAEAQEALEVYRRCNRAVDEVTITYEPEA